jgi:flagellar biosynthesis/type III secretory pathway protein FliH
MKSSDAFDFVALDDAPLAVGRAAAGVRVAQAEEVLAAAQAEAAQIRESARAAGFEAGFNAGLAAADAEVKPAVAAIAAAHAQLDAERSANADAVEVAAVELALSLAEKAIGAALEVRPEHVVDVVRGGIRRLLERDRIVVLVHPDDLEIVRGATGELQSTLGGIGSLDVQAERRVVRGGAIVRTAREEVDGRIDTQLERAREAMLGALGAEA